MTLYKRLNRFIAAPLFEKSEMLIHWYWLFVTHFYYKRYFRVIGDRSRIIRPLRLKNVRGVSIGRDVTINKHVWLQLQEEPSSSPSLTIGSGSCIGNFNHISCSNTVEIGEKVLTADRVYISDHGHFYQNPHRPIMDQGIITKGPISVGSGSWIGENACLICASVGRNCVIGANAVVLSNIPDFCVAVGVPAKVIKRFDVARGVWVSERRSDIE